MKPVGLEQLHLPAVRPGALGALHLHRQVRLHLRRAADADRHLRRLPDAEEFPRPRRHLHHPDDADDAVAGRRRLPVALHAQFGVGHRQLPALLGRLRQDRLARPDHAGAVGGGRRRHLDVDAVHRAACHRRVPRHSRDDLRSRRGRWREPGLPLLPHHPADVGAGPVHRADPAPDRQLQAVRSLRGADRRRARHRAPRPSRSRWPRPRSAISTPARRRRWPSSCSSSSSACR